MNRKSMTKAQVAYVAMEMGNLQERERVADRVRWLVRMVVVIAIVGAWIAAIAWTSK